MNVLDRFVWMIWVEMVWQGLESFWKSLRSVALIDRFGWFRKESDCD